jgi:hypothetical protein
MRSESKEKNIGKLSAKVYNLHFFKGLTEKQSKS